MKFSVIILLTILGTRSCQNKELTGTWVNEVDSLAKMIFFKNKFWSVYDQDTLSQGTFKRMNYSCDTTYLEKKVKADFIWLKDEDETCYEITGISDSILAYRFTKSGKLHVFKKRVE